MVVAEIIGWAATALRAAGMLMKSADLVKYLVSAGNFFWMINGIMTQNIPLIASNAICLVIMIIEIIRKRRNGVDPRHPELVLPRVKELVKQYERVSNDIKKAKISSKLAELEREGAMVIQELGLVTPRLHDLLIQTSRTRRGDIAREAAMEFVETSVEPISQEHTPEQGGETMTLELPPEPKEEPKEEPVVSKTSTTESTAEKKEKVTKKTVKKKAKK